MNGGYVLDFSNRSFQNFILESVGIDIYEEKYCANGDSKANRLRTLLQIEMDTIASTILEALCEHWRTIKVVNFSTITSQEQSLYESCLAVVTKLKRGSLLENISVIRPNSDDASFAVLAVAVRDLIEQDKPEEALDRLHTFAMNYMRVLCDRHEISYARDTNLNAIFGGYVKKIKTLGLIKTDMAERILLNTIQVMSGFNDVRNNHSLAHANPLLGYDESVLIFSNISGVIRFLEHIESQ